MNKLADNNNPVDLGQTMSCNTKDLNTAAGIISKDYSDMEEKRCAQNEEANLKTANILRQFGLENVKYFSFKDAQGVTHTVEIIETILKRTYPVQNDYLILNVKEGNLLRELGLGKDASFNLDYKIEKQDITETQKNFDVIKDKIEALRGFIFSIEKDWEIVSKSGTVRKVLEIKTRNNVGELVQIESLGKQQQIILEDKTRDPNSTFNIDIITTDEIEQIMSDTYLICLRIALDEEDRTENRSMSNIFRSTSAIAYIQRKDGYKHSIS